MSVVSARCTHVQFHPSSHSGCLCSCETILEPKLGLKCHLEEICYEEVLGYEEVGGRRGREEMKTLDLNVKMVPSGEGGNRVLGVNTT